MFEQLSFSDGPEFRWPITNGSDLISYGVPMAFHEFIEISLQGKCIFLKFNRSYIFTTEIEYSPPKI